jgi:hypothetical protein
MSTGIDLRNAMKEFLPLLKDKKKIREAMRAKPAELEKLVTKGALVAAKEAQKKVKSYSKKSA